ncbi:19713_t:CDS:2 [Rhizophagus irregularis]|nr:19713_t:CDS:2 [Rhizophagus irregularis]
MVDIVLKRLHNGQISNPEFLKEQVSILLYGAVNNEISKSIDLLHNYEFVHGDLHTGNVLKKQTLSSRIKKKKSNYRNTREIILDIPLCFDPNNPITDVLNQFSSANNTTKKKVKRQSKLPLSLSRTPTLLRNNNYYSKPLSKYLTRIDVEKSANASSFSSTESVNTITYQ